jgi:CRISPR-associated protein Csh1
MQDKAIAAIGEWQLEENKNLEPVDLYIENMFPGKDYQMLLLVFDINKNNDDLHCEYKGIDIEKVSAEKENYRKFAYRYGSANGGDITFTTRISIGNKSKIIENIRRKLPKTKKRYKEISSLSIKTSSIHEEKKIFDIISDVFAKDFFIIVREFIAKAKNWETRDNTIGVSILIKKESRNLFLHDFEAVKHLLLTSASQTKYKRESPKAESKSKNKICSVKQEKEEEIFGFAAPYSYSTPDKLGFISGFFNAKNNWKNYPISRNSAILLELGAKFITEHLRSRFYGHDYLIVPNPILKANKSNLKRIINTLQTALIEQEVISNERRRMAEEYVMKVIAEEDNYFNLDILFYKTSQASMKIQMHIEEQLPSRFRKLFIEVPQEVNKNKLYHNIFNSDEPNLKFSFEILKQVFSPKPKNKKEKFDSPYFLKAVNDIFRGNQMSNKYLFDKIMNFIRLIHSETLSAENNNSNFLELPLKKAVMLISYLQKLEIINYNQNYIYMEPEITSTNTSRFNPEAFHSFVKENANFLDSDIKIGIFSVGVFIKYLCDIQAHHLQTKTPPFENKLRGYKLSPEHLTNIYLEALKKAKLYQKDYSIYSDLRDIISHFYMKNVNVLNTKSNKDFLSNNELSFYFIAGMEMGKQFKREKTEN